MNTSRVVKYRLKCPYCPSSDGYHLYDDGHGFCFVCRKVTGTTLDRHEEEEFLDTDFSYQFVPWRGITRETMEFYDASMKVSGEGKPVCIGFPYPSGMTKVRDYETKAFRTVGENRSDSTLFGMDRFSSGESRSVTITEGELDAMACYQMLGSKYPVVSIRSSSSASSDCKAHWEWLNGFEKIYLCLDNDGPGRDAASSIAGLFDFNKVYHVNLTKFKDANEYLQKGEEYEFKQVWYNARKFMPEGILSKFSELDASLDEAENKPSVPYPFTTLQEMTYGIRTGERILFTALEGIGKTEIIRAIEYHLLKTTDSKLGIIHLEEAKARTIKGLAGYELEVPVHLPGSMVTNEDVKAAIRKLSTEDERIHIYSHFGSTDPNTILDTIRFLVAVCGCKYIFLDHITMVVSGLGSDDERKVLDYLSTRLAMMTEELDFALIFISHENDDGKTRGSRNISKIADLWVQLRRNLEAPTALERNTTELMVRKNRFGATTGPAGRLVFNPETFMITEQDSRALPLPEPLPH